MNTSPVFSKKPSVCRYFSSNGQCFYGDSCQFTHLRTDERKGSLFLRILIIFVDL